MPEGSVFVDGIDTDANEPDESTEESQEETQETTEEDSKEALSKSNEVNKQSQDQEVTDKGTKLDKDPLSAANQLRANAEAKVKQYEQILTNPEKFSNYGKQAGFSQQEIKKAEKQIEELDFKPESLNTAEDVAAALNKLAKVNKSYADEIARLKGGITGIGESARINSIASSINGEISSVRQKYDELNPKSENFNPELEKELGEMFEELDFDPKKGQFRGKVSLARLADRFMKATGYGKKKGSQEAQTMVKEKQRGKIVTGKGVDVAEDETKMTPAQVIAKRISKLK